MPTLHSSILLRAISFCAFFASVAFAQHEAPKHLHTVVGKHGWSDQGDLVLAVQIVADTGDVILSTRKPGDIVDPRDRDFTGMPFSLAGAYLVDAYTGKKIPALGDLPNKPFYGPMQTETVVKKGDSLGMGVAFPAPPTPPLDANGRKQDYKLLFYLPPSLDAKPVGFTIPAR